MTVVSELDRPTRLYRHFDKNDNLLYVGISFYGFDRQWTHLKHSDWRDQIVKITIQSFDTREAAEEAEKRAIRSELPQFNLVHRKKKELKKIRLCVACGQPSRRSNFCSASCKAHHLSIEYERYRQLPSEYAHHRRLPPEYARQLSIEYARQRRDERYKDQIRALLDLEKRTAPAGDAP